MTHKENSGHEEGLAVVVRCIDARYSKGSARGKLPVGFDITGAGASLRLNQSRAFLQEVVDQIKLLQSAGKDIRRLVVADHFSVSGGHGCTAYGNDDSRERHEANLYKAAALLKNEFPALYIELLLHDIDQEKVEIVQNEC